MLSHSTLKKKSTAVLLFLAFSTLILSAILIIRPGWGFMDDRSNLEICRSFWQQPSLQALRSLFESEISWGRFRPLYIFWILTSYQIGINAPHLIYFFITLIGLFMLPLWGLILDKVFNSGRRSPFLIWIYPLTFFIFTPFWNAFMYLSIQEKFIFFFSGPAILFFLKAYERNCKADLIWVFFWSAMAIMGKETGIVLFIAFAAYAFFDAIVFRRRPAFSWGVWAISTIILVGYYIFIHGLLKNYSAKYAGNTNLHSLLGLFQNSPALIKILLVLSAFMLIGQIVRKYSTPHYQEDGKTLFAWLTLFYIVILLPWGFFSYILPPLGIFAVSMATPLVQLGDKYTWFKSAKRLVLTGLAFLVAILIIVPQIQKMADKRAIIQQIDFLAAKNPSAVFFYPPPYIETAIAIKTFSKSNVVYLSEDTIDPSRIASNASAYLLMNDECWAVNLVDLSPEQAIYTSSTWQIIPLSQHPGARETFKAGYARNPAQKIKNFFKNL